MGGLGSGRQFGAGCTDEFRSIDIRRWQREGLLDNGRYFNWQWSRRGKPIADINVKVEGKAIRLFYSVQENGGGWEKFDYRVYLDTTPCHYGGERYWFICPAANCGRRVAILYGGKYFACRHCYSLAYRTQRETKENRLTRRADKIREKLKWEPGILNGNGWKPKGMHWQTFSRLQNQHDFFVDQSLNLAAKRFKMNISDFLL